MRTGAEAIFFITRGTSDVTFKNLVFATPSVDSFMQTTMKIDPNQFLSKMEAFSLGGLKGRFRI